MSEETESTEETTGSTETEERTTATETETEPGYELAKWKSLARKNEEQAKKNADAAVRLKALEDAQKSEQEKLSDALEAAKAESATSKAEAARLSAAMKHGLSLDDLDLLGTGTPEEIEERAERLSQRLAGVIEGTPVVPSSRNQGREGAPAEETDPRKLAADLPRY